MNLELQIETGNVVTMISAITVRSDISSDTSSRITVLYCFLLYKYLFINLDLVLFVFLLVLYVCIVCVMIIVYVLLITLTFSNMLTTLVHV